MHAKNQNPRSIGSKNKVETNERADKTDHGICPTNADQSRSLLERAR